MKNFYNFHDRRMNALYKCICCNGGSLDDYNIKLVDYNIDVRNVKTGQGWHSDDLQWIKRQIKKDIVNNK